MRLFRYELLKVLSKKLFWGFLAAVLAVNILALWWLNQPEGLPHSDTKAVYDAIRLMEQEDKIAYVQEQIDLMDAFATKENYAFALEWQIADDEEYLSMLREEYETVAARFGDRLDRAVTGVQAAAQKEIYTELLDNLSTDKYADYLQYVENQAKIRLGSSIFGSNLEGFSRKNIEKTRDDFAVMSGIVTSYDVNTGLLLLFDSPSADILLILLIAVMCLALVTDEKDKRLFLLVKATPGGRGRTVLAKLGALAVCIICASALIFLCNAVYGQAIYGFGDLSRSIQSVPELMGSTLRLSVGQFMALFFLVKTAGLFAAGMAVMLFALHARHSVLMLLTTVLTSIGSVLLTVIHPEAAANWLRYLNPAAFARPFEIISGYKNLSLFGHPVNLIPVFAVFASLLLTVLFAAVYLSFTRKRGLENNRELFKLKRLPTLPIIAGIRWYEFRKLAFSNKAAFILILFIIIQAYAVRGFQPPFLGYDHYYFKYTMLSMQGELTDEKEAFILSEKARFDEAERALAELEAKVAGGELGFEQMEIQGRKYQNILAEKSAFDRVYTRYEYVKNTPGAQFLYDTGYARLFGLSDADAGLDGGMRMLAALILCLCGVFAIEYKTGMYKVLNATRRGNSDTVRLKLLLSVITTVAVFVCAYAPELLYIYSYFGLPGLTLPLSSVAPAELGAFPSALGGLPVWGYITALYLIRLAVCMAAAVMILALSLAVHSNVYAALCGAAVLMAPLLLHVFHVRFMDGFSLYNLLLVNPYFTGMAVWRTVVQVSVYALITCVCVLFLSKRFGMAAPVDIRFCFMGKNLDKHITMDHNTSDSG